MNDDGRFEFESITQAALRYWRLHQLLGTCRSIPLKKGATHVSRGDSHARWEQIREEFARLAPCFPLSNTLEWRLLETSLRTDIQTDARRKEMERLTGRRWSVAMYDRRTAQVYGDIGQALRNRHFLSPDAPYIE